MAIKIKTAIKNYKLRLIRKAGKIGVWENFGQEEVRVLENTYREHQYLNDGVWDEISSFDDWCQTYTG